MLRSAVFLLLCGTVLAGEFTITKTTFTDTSCKMRADGPVVRYQNDTCYNNRVKYTGTCGSLKVVKYAETGCEGTSTTSDGSDGGDLLAPVQISMLGVCVKKSGSGGSYSYKPVCSGASNLAPSVWVFLLVGIASRLSF